VLRTYGSTMHCRRVRRLSYSTNVNHLLALVAHRVAEFGPRHPLAWRCGCSAKKYIHCWRTAYFRKKTFHRRLWSDASLVILVGIPLCRKESKENIPQAPLERCISLVILVGIPLCRKESKENIPQAPLERCISLVILVGIPLCRKEPEGTYSAEEARRGVWDARDMTLPQGACLVLYGHFSPHQRVHLSI
jgi:hypothetical protein